MTRTRRALHNAALAVAVFLAYVAMSVLLVGGESVYGEVLGPAAFVALVYGAPLTFLGSVILDPIAARVRSPVIRRLLVVMLLVCGAVAFALWFDGWLAPDDDRAQFGWLTIPAALAYGLLVRLSPSPASERSLEAFAK